MIAFLLALAASSPVPAPAPTPLTDVHQRDIGCVALLGIIAHEQREGKAALQDYPDIRDTGKRWAGIVGDRVTFESGQPREVVAFAIRTAVDAEQAEVLNAKTAEAAAAYARGRFDECKTLMDAQLAVADAAADVIVVDERSAVLTPPPGWQTDEPEKLALFRQQLRADQTDRLRISYCAGMIGASYREIVSREGKGSRDALAMGRLDRAFTAKLANLPGTDPGGQAGVEFAKHVQASESREGQMGRCLRLGESLAMALPPE